MMATEAAGLGLLAKFGWIKAATLGAALAGAGMMAIFRPPKTRKELFSQGLVALGSSLLFGNTVALWIAHVFPFIDLATTSLENYVQYLVSVHGLVGALSWGLWGGFSVFRDKTGSQSITDTVKDVKIL